MLFLSPSNTLLIMNLFLEQFETVTALLFLVSSMKEETIEYFQPSGSTQHILGTVSRLEDQTPQQKTSGTDRPTIAHLPPQLDAITRTIRSCISKEAANGIRKEYEKQSGTNLIHTHKVNMSPAYVLRCKMLFENYDREKRGKITVGALTQLWRDIGKDASPAAVRSWLQRKQGSDNEITFLEFVDACQFWFGSNPIDIPSTTTNKKTVNKNINTTSNPPGMRKSFSSPLIQTAPLQSYEMMQRKQNALSNVSYDSTHTTDVVSGSRCSSLTDVVIPTNNRF